MKNKREVAFLGILGVIGLTGLIIYLASRSSKPAPASNRSTQWEKVGDGKLYENEKRIQLVRGPDGHVAELIIHHTIKQNALGKIPEGILEL